MYTMLINGRHACYRGVRYSRGARAAAAGNRKSVDRECTGTWDEFSLLISLPMLLPSLLSSSTFLISGPSPTARLARRKTTLADAIRAGYIREHASTLPFALVKEIYASAGHLFIYQCERRVRAYTREYSIREF
ncbi:hypothetical protein K0M31_014773 [Melipona bicolor]|uniref:Uncharacterized protein n=1 Tax=Melipona bicolor TaxID=60889 RepID=A0AA40FGU5_9HYME|nr:hypothetical protein K0M31_014773 [Melipona bicolor]